MTQRTALFDNHLAAGARMVDFAGWEMPIHYGSQVEEHHQVRRDAGMFDVSHMTVLDLDGPDSRDYLRRLLANDVARLKTPGKALYSCMLNEQGGVIDDLITYWLGGDRYRIVVNAATREKDLAWMRERLQGFDARLTERDDLAMIAVQGPNARERAATVLGKAAEPALALSPFQGVELEDGLFVARTGYTGEDGFEILLPTGRAGALWEALRQAGVQPAGLGARDTLRLEAGMNLYGQDMDETVTPLESGLGWTVAWAPEDRDFIGRAALQTQRAVGGLRRFVGLVLEARGVPRAGQRVILPEGGEGEITSGSFSPTLQRGIALARVPADTGERVEVEIRSKRLPARVVKPAFVRHGKSLID